MLTLLAVLLRGARWQLDCHLGRRPPDPQRYSPGRYRQHLLAAPNQFPRHRNTTILLRLTPHPLPADSKLHLLESLPTFLLPLRAHGQGVLPRRHQRSHLRSPLQPHLYPQLFPTLQD